VGSLTVSSRDAVRVRWHRARVLAIECESTESWGDGPGTMAPGRVGAVVCGLASFESVGRLAGECRVRGRCAHPAGVGTVGAVGGTCALEGSRETG